MQYCTHTSPKAPSILVLMLFRRLEDVVRIQFLHEFLFCLARSFRRFLPLSLDFSYGGFENTKRILLRLGNLDPARSTKPTFDIAVDGKLTSGQGAYH